MRKLLLSLVLVVSFVVCLVSLAMAAPIAPASKADFIAGWSFGTGDIEGDIIIGGNLWTNLNPDGTNKTGTGGATTDTPYAAALEQICYGSEIPLALDLPKKIAAGTYLVRLLYCENWWADDTQHRKAFNVTIAGKLVASELLLPVNKGEFIINEFVVDLPATNLLEISMTPGEGGGDDTNLILSAVELLKK